jgi:hypothetical protein
MSFLCRSVRAVVLDFAKQSEAPGNGSSLLEAGGSPLIWTRHKFTATRDPRP